jgi:hypothetical protein
MKQFEDGSYQQRERTRKRRISKLRTKSRKVFPAKAYMFGETVLTAGRLIIIALAWFALNALEPVFQSKSFLMSFSAILEIYLVVEVLSLAFNLHIISWISNYFYSVRDDFDSKEHSE